MIKTEKLLNKIKILVELWKPFIQKNFPLSAQDIRSESIQNVIPVKVICYCANKSFNVTSWSNPIIEL